MLCLGRARLFRGLLAHPLVVAPVVAGALGDPFIGVFVGIGLAFLWERDDSPGGLAPLNGAIGSAVGAAVASVPLLSWLI